MTNTEAENEPSRSYMTRHEIDAFEPDRLPDPGVAALDHARHVMEATGCWNARQQMGRRWPIGCVALEITQKCNLDCTLCYLSESSEAVRDLPFEEVLRRIELIHSYYGCNTDVQITGGEPTLRKREDLIAIVRKVRALGMRPTLMTNGLRASRALLEELAQAGLMDVTFHVDTTQRIKGYRSEVELNALREQYVDRTRDLPLSVFFTTTVHRGNFHEIPALAAFFKAHAGAVRTVSFQLAADTGRGIERNRGAAITPDSVARQVEVGAGTRINFQASLVGHPACSRYGMCLEANGKLFDAFDDGEFIARMQAATAHIVLHRNNPKRVVTHFLRWLAANPAHWVAVLAWTARKAREMRADLIVARGRVKTISFMIHNFMDSDTLERNRVDACIFKVMTAGGPISMCLHNTKRDTFILQPIRIGMPDRSEYWQPLTGMTTPDHVGPTAIVPADQPAKKLRGRARERMLAERRARLKAVSRASQETGDTVLEP